MKKAKEIHCFRFIAEIGQVIEKELNSMKCGVRLLLGFHNLEY